MSDKKSEDAPSELEMLVSQWKKIVDETKKINFKAGALLSTAHLKSLNGNEVEFEFRFSSHAEQMAHEENGALIKAAAEAISSIAGRYITITPYHVSRYFDTNIIDNTLQDLIDLRERIYAVRIQEFLETNLYEVAEGCMDGAESVATLDLLDRTIAYTLAKRDRDAEREMHEQGNW